MLVLIPEKLNFVVSTTDILVQYTERNNTILQVDVLLLEDFIDRKKYTPIVMNFKIVAELKCSTLNFQEAFYEQYKIIPLDESENDHEFWQNNGYHPNPKIYQVSSSTWLKESLKKYDPQNGLDLKHFLIESNDSYIELLANGFEWKIDNN